MKKIISLLLVLVTLLSMSALSGCAEKTDAELIIGTWNYEFDFAKKYTESEFYSYIFEDYIPTDKSCIVKYTLTCTEGGKFTMKPQDNIEEDLRTFFTDFYTATVTQYVTTHANKYEMSEEEVVMDFFDASTISEVVNDIVDKEVGIFFDIEIRTVNSLPNIDNEYSYTIADGLITIEHSDFDAEYWGEKFQYTLSEESLTLTSEDAESHFIYPMTFTKAE